MKFSLALVTDAIRDTDRRPHLQRRLWAALLAAVACLSSTSCGDSTPRPDVVLVVVDTLRADKLGLYGNQRRLTPGLDELGGASVVFENASSHAPWTLPSFATMFTSQTPSHHGAGGGLDNQGRAGFRKLGEEATTLAETLERRGYETALFGNVTFLASNFGLQQGFDHTDVESYNSNQEMRAATETTDAALAWFRKTKGPRFLVVHYFDPHAVYAPPADFRRTFASELDRESPFVFGTRQDMGLLRSGQLELDEVTVRRAEKLYDAEIAYVDSELTRLFEGLEEDRGERFLLVTADHGEEFLDHDGFEHGHTLYQELLHVPLLINGPGLEARRVSDPIGHLDLAPTICGLVGVPSPESFRGQNLASALRKGDEVRGRGVLAHGNMWGPARTSWRHGPFKLIRPSQASEDVELYDLERDPDEQENLALTDPATYDKLEDELSAVLASVGMARGERAALSESEARDLERLGYLGSEGLSDDDSGD